MASDAKKNLLPWREPHNHLLVRQAWWVWLRYATMLELSRFEGPNVAQSPPFWGVGLLCSTMRYSGTGNAVCVCFIAGFTTCLESPWSQVSTPE